MNKTTVYLPDDLRAALARVAAERKQSEAELIREGIRLVIADQASPLPTVPLGCSGEPDLAEHVDEALSGFGTT